MGYMYVFPVAASEQPEGEGGGAVKEEEQQPEGEVGGAVKEEEQQPEGEGGGAVKEEEQQREEGGAAQEGKPEQQQGEEKPGAIIALISYHALNIYVMYLHGLSVSLV